MHNKNKMSLAAWLILAAVPGNANVLPRSHAEGPPAPSRWEKEIAAFERQDKAHAPPKNPILFVGSSSIRLWDLKKSFPDMVLLNRGFGGSQIADAIYLAPRIILKYEPRMVVFYAGDNDLAAGKSPQQVLSDFQSLAQIIHRDLPRTRIVFLSIKTSVARWKLVDKIRAANRLVEAYCKEHERLEYIDVGSALLGEDGKPRAELFARDGLHLNERGYARWAPIVRAAIAASRDEKGMLQLTLRSRLKDKTGPTVVVEKKAAWDPEKTALIICDMWDDHWCKSAARRVNELSGPVNEAVKAARARGVFIIHAPSSVTAFYQGTPARKLAQDAPFAPTPVPLSTAERWGTAWCWPDAKREPAMPIDDSDMGCDCAVKCTIREAWKRQIATIEIAPGDALTDNGQETWNLLRARGIDNVMICGVHLNMCVLGRPFAIRQLVHLGKNVALVRDLTDTMYNPEKPPKVDHFAGTDLVIEHVEKFWCPSFVSTDLTGRPSFHFQTTK
jgi:lysophospholipase L1-like esterase/nicotinamidase-related amidase